MVEGDGEADNAGGDLGTLAIAHVRPGMANNVAYSTRGGR